MKKARLDKILLNMGAVTEEQITKALLRQKSRGGKLGAHLLFYRYVTEEQLVQALAEQFSTDGVKLSTCDIPEEVVKKLLPDVAEAYTVIPFRFDRDKGELHVAVSDPEDGNVLPALRRSGGSVKIILHVAPEVIIRNKIAVHYHGRSQEQALPQIIDLPDLFPDEKDRRAPLSSLDEETVTAVMSDRRMVMLTKQVFLKNVLPALFEREGIRLSVVTTMEELLELLRTAAFQHALVSEDSREDIDQIAVRNKDRVVFPEITVFRTVGNSLIENLVPYRVMFECLLAAVKYIAGQRTIGLPITPPYAVIVNDIAEVGQRIGLSRIAVDGLRIAAHLLIPALSQIDAASESFQPLAEDIFSDLEASQQIARSIKFPWDLNACMAALGAAPAEKAVSTPENASEPALAAAVLTLVWYRHYGLRSIDGGAPEELEMLKSRLRNQVGRLASSPVVEAYINVLEKTTPLAGADHDIFVVGHSSGHSKTLVMTLKHHGFRTVEASTLQEAHKMYLRRRPAAMLIHVDELLLAANALCRHIRENEHDARTIFFALTLRSEPSFLLNLMETWFSDVLPLPMSDEVMIARISKAFSMRDKAAGRPLGQGFSATFKDLSFVDLVQALGTGMKSVRMHIDHGSGKQADVYFRKGMIVHAICGEIRGVEAVYEVIRWLDDGTFRIEPASSFPLENVAVANDYILLEGSRLLDEG